MFVPTVSSLIRSGSFSNDPIVNAAAGVSVRRTTNSCVMSPSLSTLNVTGPAETLAAVGVIDHWFKPIPMVPPAVDGTDFGVPDAADDDEHATPPSRRNAGMSTHLPAKIFMSSPPFLSLQDSPPWRRRASAERPGRDGPRDPFRTGRRGLSVFRAGQPGRLLGCFSLVM